MDAEAYPPAGRLKPLILRDKHLLLFYHGEKHAIPLDDALARSTRTMARSTETSGPRSIGVPIPGSRIDRDEGTE